MQSELISKYSKNLDSVSNFFGVGKIKPLQTEYLSEALANRNFRVVTDYGVFIIKILVNETEAQVENHLAILNQLEVVGLKTATLLKSPNEKYIFRNQRLLATMSPTIEGVYPSNIDAQLCSEIGKILALFHSAVKRLPNQNVGWLNPERLKSVNANGNALMQQAVDLTKSELQIYKLGLPTGIIHGDFFDTNLFVDPKNVHHITTVFDFEESEYNIFLVDLVRSVLAVCKSRDGLSLNQELFTGMLQGYDSVRKLTRQEREHLLSVINYVAGMTAIWFMNNGYEEHAKKAISRASSFKKLDNTF